MSVAIVVLPGAIPAIFVETEDAALVARLATLKDAPPLDSVAAARAWLATLALPSGWFASEADARAFVAQCRAPQTMTPAEFARLREASGLTREAFGSAIGYTGNSNTRHKQVYQMERGEKPILDDKAIRARLVAAERRPATAGAVADKIVGSSYSALTGAKAAKKLRDAQTTKLLARAKLQGELKKLAKAADDLEATVAAKTRRKPQPRRAAQKAG